MSVRTANRADASRQGGKEHAGYSGGEGNTMPVLRVFLKTCCFAGLLIFAAQAGSPAQSSPDLVRQIAELMAQGPSGKAHQRFVHAKGVVCQGRFQASPDAAAISRAAHFDGESVPFTVRFSDGAPDVKVADSSPDAAPRGMAIRFGHNGFIVGSGEDFLALRQAIGATDSSKPHPSPIEEFLESRPKALKFVRDSKQAPVSFATESFYSIVQNDGVTNAIGG